MNNDRLVIEERQRDIGKFMVGRLLPFRKKRQVGPFVFIDHMGPTQLPDGKYFDIDQHPHIGLCTLTYLFDGEIEHRDSTGAAQVVKAGDAGFMSAGKGVTHTERTPQHLRKEGEKVSLHGYQIWVALPVDKEEMEPRFDYYAADKLPEWTEEGLRIRLVAGSAFGKTSPLKGYSHMFMIDVLAEEATDLVLTDHIRGEIGFVIVKGSIEEDGETIASGKMLISREKEHCSIRLEKGTQLLIFGGDPLPEEHYLMWNFASSSKDRLEQAKKDWQEKKFPKVPGDETYIPFPV